jgi:hypothetical protein
MGNADEASVLSLAEVQVFGPLNCPATGDTHCTGFTIDGSPLQRPDVYTLSASAKDDSADWPKVTFTIDNGVDPPRVISPPVLFSTRVKLTAGSYTITSAFDDSDLCDDKAPDAVCSKTFVVTGDPDDLALNGTASQSTTAFGGDPSFAIDGVTSGVFADNSVTHTDNELNPMWQVDLGALLDIDRIVIWGRTDVCCASRLTDFHVAVLDDNDAEVFGDDYFTDGTFPDTTTDGFEIQLPPSTKGNVVRVSLNQGGYLSLAEVQVFRPSGQVKGLFHRGDANADGTTNITDGIFVLNYLFLGGPTPPCLEAANADDGPDLSITSGIYILNYLFLGGPAPPAPGTEVNPCGPDPAGSVSALGCSSYPSCN